jgi:hypothetical protein
VTRANPTTAIFSPVTQRDASLRNNTRHSFGLLLAPLGCEQVAFGGRENQSQGHRFAAAVATRPRRDRSWLLPSTRSGCGRHLSCTTIRSPKYQLWCVLLAACSPTVTAGGCTRVRVCTCAAMLSIACHRRLPCPHPTPCPAPCTLTLHPAPCFVLCATLKARSCLPNRPLRDLRKAWPSRSRCKCGGYARLMWTLGC